MTIPANLFEPLSIAIGKTFETIDLDTIMLKTTGNGLFEVFVGPGKPLRETAYLLLQKLDELGIESIVFAEMLARRPQDDVLRGAIGQACPAALAALPTTDQRVSSIVTGLAAVKLKLAEPAVLEALKASRVQLKMIAETIDILEIYKNLHDCLHQLQVKQFYSLRSAAKKLSDDPLQAMELRVYHSQLRIACLGARQWVDKLPGGPIVQQTEMLWIDELEGAGNRFHAAINQKASKPAQTALKDIRRVMRGTPGHLNDLIFATATALPLEDLAKALGIVAAAGGGPEIAAAHEALLLVIPAMHARVVEHKKWQAADNRISDLDELIDSRPADLIDEFSTDWLDLKTRMYELTSLDPSAQWSGEVANYSTQVEDYLAREVADDAFNGAFAAYRAEAQFRFLTVDSSLKSDCGALVKIGAPLHSILGEIGNV